MYCNAIDRWEIILKECTYCWRETVVLGESDFVHGYMLPFRNTGTPTLMSEWQHFLFFSNILALKFFFLVAVGGTLTWGNQGHITRYEATDVRTSVMFLQKNNLHQPTVGSLPLFWTRKYDSKPIQMCSGEKKKTTTYFSFSHIFFR